MRRGPWHQLGDRSQKLTREQLEAGAGVGAVISPRDLSFRNSVIRAEQYHELGADVLIDQQFYLPEFTNKHLESYPINPHRLEVSSLMKISDSQLSNLARSLEEVHTQISAQAVIAPSLILEHGRPDIHRLNTRLFRVAKGVGDQIGIPTFATVLIGHSATEPWEQTESVLSQATSINPDGWYFGFEFMGDRIPSSEIQVKNCFRAGLVLAATGRPVFHAFAGPMSLLSFGFGASAAGIGHSQNLWQFRRERWQTGDGGGGGGDAPARFFSRNLWGTIIFPDEYVQLSQELQQSVIVHSAFSQDIPLSPPLSWNRWLANKHLVNAICQEIDNFSQKEDARAWVNYAIEKLDTAQKLYNKILEEGVKLGDNSNAYHENWNTVLTDLLVENSDDFDYLMLL